MHRGEIDLPPVLETEADLASQGGFAAAVGVFTPEEGIASEAIRFETLRNETPRGAVAD